MEIIRITNKEEAKAYAKKLLAEAKPVKGYNYPRMSVVVPLEEISAHNYPIEQPFLVTNKSTDIGQAQGSLLMESIPSCFGSRSWKGNNHSGAWRYATEEEIDLFFDTVDAKAFERAIE